MNKNLPDKWVRRAIHLAVNNILVDGNTIPNYDWRVTGNTIPDFYTIVTTQNNVEEQSTKCDSVWRTFALLEIYTTYNPSLNPGSRLLADNITDACLTATHNLVLDVASDLTIITQNNTLEPDLSLQTENQNVFRKFIRYELLIT